MMSLNKAFLGGLEPDLLFVDLLLSSPYAGTQNKLRNVTFGLRLSYEKLRTVTKVTGELPKSYETATKRYVF